jgi:hypothetical protein
MKAAPAAAAAAGALTLLKTVTLAAPASSISATPLAAYRAYLVIIEGPASNTNATYDIRLNGDAAANHYQWQFVEGAGGGAAAAFSAGDTGIQICAATLSFSDLIIELLISCTDVTKKKHVVGTSFLVGVNIRSSEFGGNWNDTTNQVSRIDLILTGGGTLSTGTVMIVYGLT